MSFPLATKLLIYLLNVFLVKLNVFVTARADYKLIFTAFKASTTAVISVFLKTFFRCLFADGGDTFRTKYVYKLEKNHKKHNNITINAMSEHKNGV